MEEFEHHERKGWIVYLVVGIIIGSILGGIFGTFIVFKNPTIFPWILSQTPQTQIGTNQTQVQVPTNLIDIQNQVEEVANKVSPAVVRIVSTTQVISPFFLQVIPQEGLGSGVIIREDGLILTNNHVIADATKIEVTLSNGKTYKGEVLGADPISDLALVKINATNLPTAPLGDSSKVKVGEFVVAIGNPYGLDHTVTFGVISAVERNIDTGNNTMYGVIQTDAAINPGNSGGPLVNLKGEVIGINTMIYQNAQGLGFAVSSNTAKKVIDSILKTGKVRWPYLGIQVTTMTQEIANSYNIAYTEGAFVVDVVVGSPAYMGGIRKYDVITAVNGKAIKTADDLISTIRNYSPNDRVTITVSRNGKMMDLQVVLGSK
ncbi:MULTISPECIES: S1C family serine protease [unclassified Caldisericum]|uniref:Serine protease n=1 Tax=Caldisericum exile TaxID=693075 RepID=A0A2J6X477_9BACT|nr:MAG: serine protease [Caldisericum exile]HEM56225.1 PDZ domain-containing protein [Thermodesulfobium narugense]